MLKYLKEFRKHKNIIVQTLKESYRVYKIESNKFVDGKDELHVALKNSKLNESGKDAYAVIGLYDLHLRKNKLRNILDPFLGKGKVISIYVIFTSGEDALSITIRPLPKTIVKVKDLLAEVQSYFGGDVVLNGRYINPDIDSILINKSNLSYEELTNRIKITGY